MEVGTYDALDAAMVVAAVGIVVDVKVRTLVLSENDVETPPSTEIVAIGELNMDVLVNVVVTGVAAALVGVLSCARCPTAEMLREQNGLSDTNEPRVDKTT